MKKTLKNLTKGIFEILGGMLILGLALAFMITPSTLEILLKDWDSTLTFLTALTCAAQLGGELAVKILKFLEDKITSKKYDSDDSDHF